MKLTSEIEFKQVKQILDRIADYGDKYHWLAMNMGRENMYAKTADRAKEYLYKNDITHPMNLRKGA